MTPAQTQLPGRRPPQLTREYLERKVAEALMEDLGQPFSDPTSERSVPAALWGEAELISRADGVVAGMFVAVEVFRQLARSRLEEQGQGGGAARPGAEGGAGLTALVPEPAAVRASQTLAVIRGPLRELLAGERVALNFLQRLSGVATLTRRYVEAARGTRAQILDTRKTTPGLRPLERYAVLAGGGANHRYNLASSVLVKDNHVAAAGGVAAAARRVRASGLTVEVEVDRLDQLGEALESGAQIILLDNMTPGEVAEAVRRTAGRAPLEVSGGVSLATVAAYAATGVDRLSVGALTHSAPALDIAMEVTKTWIPEAPC
jgi:nicotinate-nucleotide pyrophosphorylase (carboxylating)